MASKSILSHITGIVGREHVLAESEDLVAYSYDSTAGYRVSPAAVIFPQNTEQVSSILKLASETNTPVVPRGAGTSLSGGAVPVEGCLLLVMTKMNQILEIDEENLTATAECGVITADFHSAVEKRGLFYAPDPGSMSVTTLGGNVGENAGGLRGLKYGVTRDYMLGMELVLASGDVLKLGGKTIKNVTGYDLLRLLTGSEGTLGVITSIIVKLLPLPETRKSMLATFDNLDDAAQAIVEIIQNKVVPVTLELMDNVTIRCVEDYAHVGLPTSAEALLLIEVDGIPEVVDRDADRVIDVCKKHSAAEIRIARNDEERDTLWEARRRALSALARVRPTTIVEDATVPRSRIPEMFRAISQISRRHNIMIGTFGHAGDGNFHPTILTDERDKEEMKRVDKAVEEIFAAALALGGTLSGEHGIGLAKARFVPDQLGREGVELLRRIKHAFDPKQILNPGKATG